MTALKTLRVNRLAAVSLFALSLAGLAGAVSAQEAATPEAITPLSAEDALAVAVVEEGVLRFDVAEDMTKFVFDPDNVHDDGMPAYGASFITGGYLYPAGTLSESNGVNADGSPEFPDQVLGQWVCRGWFVGDGARTTTGAMVITTQIYSFGDEPGAATLVSDGYELVDAGVEFNRAITGGTGDFAGAGGEAHQTMLGLNATEGFNLQFEIELAGAGS